MSYLNDYVESTEKVGNHDTKTWVNWIARECQIFKMPYCGHLGVLQKDKTPTMKDAAELIPTIKLPHPITAFEYEGESNHPDRPFKYKAILIAAQDENDLIKLHTVFKIDRSEEWSHAPIMALLRGGDTCDFEVGYIHARAGKPTHTYWWGKDNFDLNKNETYMWREMLSIVLEFCVISSCTNIAYKTVEPPEKLNAKRVKNGKMPLFTYKELELTFEDREVGRSGVATGRTVRSHLRRGHIRKIHSGRLIWVNGSFVHGKSDGLVAKDYQVCKPRRSPAQYVKPNLNPTKSN